MLLLAYLAEPEYWLSALERFPSFAANCCCIVLSKASAAQVLSSHRRLVPGSAYPFSHRQTCYMCLIHDLYQVNSAYNVLIVYS